MDSKEQWQPIPGYEGIYAVSSWGRILSRARSRPPHILKPIYQRDGYLTVILYKDHHPATSRIHRLVLQAFAGPRPHGYVSNHIDGLKSNNRLSNLEYIPRRQNDIHAAQLGLKPRGERHWKAKLTEDDIYAIRELASAHVNQDTIAAIYGTSQACISDIFLRKSWAWLKDM